MQGELERVLSLRDSGYVKRFHTQQTLRDDLISSHSWGVASLIILLHKNPSKKLICSALFHDIGEFISGDTPWTAKQLDKELKTRLKKLENKHISSLKLNYENSLTEKEVSWLKSCDMLDLIFFCMEELEMGNRKILPVFIRGKDSLRKSSNTPKEVLKILDLVENRVIAFLS